MEFSLSLFLLNSHLALPLCLSPTACTFYSLPSPSASLFLSISLPVCSFPCLVSTSLPLLLMFFLECYLLNRPLSLFPLILSHFFKKDLGSSVCLEPGCPSKGHGFDTALLPTDLAGVSIMWPRER